MVGSSRAFVITCSGLCSSELKKKSKKILRAVRVWIVGLDVILLMSQEKVRKDDAFNAVAAVLGWILQAWTHSPCISLHILKHNLGGQDFALIMQSNIQCPSNSAVQLEN
jgi:hypothetical protein